MLLRILGNEARCATGRTRVVPSSVDVALTILWGEVGLNRFRATFAQLDGSKSDGEREDYPQHVSHCSFLQLLS